MNIPEHEPARQEYYMSLLRDMMSKKQAGHESKPTYHIATFGCQMNARDSEKLSGILEDIGFRETESEDADFVLFNTCTVRENANEKVYGRLGRLKHLKESHPDMLIAICGCMMQEPDEVERVRKSFRYVDIVFGTHNIYKLAELLYDRYNTSKQVIDVYDSNSEIVEKLPTKRKYSFKSGVNIMFGCNNFCSYCIVPYVRGRERSRKSEDIIREITDLVTDGVVEVMLLGQNVNSYGRGLEEQITFAQLLKKVAAIDGLKRIRFMTSHPKDLSDELIEVMATEPKICRHLHLPLQSGSTQILDKMNRKYTKEGYLKLAERIRERMPDISLTTDIIVGFPSETEEDFEDTIDVVKKVRYDSAFTFIYSRRTGTPAADMSDQIPEDVIKNRFDRLLEVVQTISAEQTGRYVGQIVDVLIEEPDDHMDGYMTGRMSNNTIVHLKGSPDSIGSIIRVKLDECKGFYYMGEAVD